MSEIKLVTFNICHGKGLDGSVALKRIAQTLNTIDADLVALQEVDRRMPRSYLQNQAQILARQTGMNFAYAPNLHFSGLASFGNAILSKYPILEASNLLLPGKKEQRGLQHCLLDLGNLGKISLFNTHLGLSSEERLQQGKSVAKAIERTGYPALLAGDFNFSPAS